MFSAYLEELKPVGVDGPALAAGGSQPTYEVKLRNTPHSWQAKHRSQPTMRN